MRERRGRRTAGSCRSQLALGIGVQLLLAVTGCAAGEVTPVSETPPPAAAGPVGQPAAEPSNFEGAGSSLVPLAPTRVRRRVEDVTLRRQGSYWSVEAVNIFESGPVPESVPVGLPDFEGVSDQGGRRSTLSEVSLLVDGIEVAPALEPAPVSADLGAPGGIGRLYAWELRFAAEEEKVVRLRFHLLASRTRQGDELLFFYLNTGTPWFGESGRINLRVELEELSTRELVLDWLRPAGFGLRPQAVVWQIHEEEPESDLVLALRPFVDPLAGYEDRSMGLLALPPAEMAARLDRGTAMEWEFWRAFLRVRRGEPAPGGKIGELLAAEEWYRPNSPDQTPRPMTAEEESLFEMLTAHLQKWEAAQLPSPAELRATTP